MTPDELQDLARAMEKVPGLKGIDMRDVRRLAQLLHDHPEIGAIELLVEDQLKNFNLDDLRQLRELLDAEIAARS